MKKLYVIILFLVFFNICMFMFGAMNLFRVDYSGDETSFGVDSDGNIVGNGTGGFQSMSGFSFDNLFTLFFGDNLGVTIAILGVAGIAAWLTKSPAPFVIGFIGNVMKNIYVSSISVMDNLPGINEWMMLAGLIGMVLLFVITCAEVLTHGEA